MARTHAYVGFSRRDFQLRATTRVRSHCDLGYEGWSKRTSVPGRLAVGENLMILGFLVLTHYQGVSDRQTDALPTAKFRSSIAERDSDDKHTLNIPDANMFGGLA